MLLKCQTSKSDHCVQVLFPLLALVPRKEVRNDVVSEIMAPLLGGDAEEEQRGNAVEDVLSQQQASAQADATGFGDTPGRGLLP